jgi:thiamine pyrophosphokinase
LLRRDTRKKSLQSKKGGIKHMNHKRILIFTGGTLDIWALDEVKDDDILIGADRGALFLIRHGLQPDIALGDFDSVSPSEKEEIQLISKHFISCDAVMKDL